jgi:hypothetical protein
MPKFYYKVRASNQSTYAYCVEAPDQQTADASIAAYSDMRDLERIDESDVPPGMNFKPSNRKPAIWEGE